MLGTLLIALWAGFLAIDDLGPQLLRRPLVIAPLIGLIMGDLPTALLIGATLEVMWMGVGNVGAFVAPDMISGTAISTALGIATGDPGTAVATAVALAVPTSLLAQQLLIIYRSAIVALNPIVERWAEQGDFKKIYRIQYIPMAFVFLIRAVPTFLAIHFGAGVIENIVAALPVEVMTGLTVASRIIPAVGIGLLMLMMIKKFELWGFLIAGFALSVYLGLSVLPITLIALPFALIYDLVSQNKGTSAPTASISERTAEEEDYDL